jgi:hypothetical protein
MHATPLPSTLPEQLAEKLYQSAWSLSKLVKPEDDHEAIARGLADAMFGQGKVQEATQVLKVRAGCGMWSREQGG